MDKEWESSKYIGIQQQNQRINVYELLVQDDKVAIYVFVVVSFSFELLGKNAVIVEIFSKIV